MLKNIFIIKIKQLFHLSLLTKHKVWFTVDALDNSGKTGALVFHTHWHSGGGVFGGISTYRGYFFPIAQTFSTAYNDNTITLKISNKLLIKLTKLAVTLTY